MVLNSDNNPPRWNEDLYHSLRGMAHQLLSSQRSDHTLQPTALVHEAYLRLVDHPCLSQLDRSVQLSLAAKVMRSVLIDHARRRAAIKRGGESKRVPLDQTILAYEEHICDLLQLDEAMEKLAEIDGRLAHLVELRFFGGLRLGDVATVLKATDRTLRRDWRFAKAWLREELGETIRNESRFLA